MKTKVTTVSFFYHSHLAVVLRVMVMLSIALPLLPATSVAVGPEHLSAAAPVAWIGEEERKADPASMEAAFAPLAPLAPSLEIDKDTTTPTVIAGGQVTYTIVVRNAVDPAVGVTVSDTLPVSFTYASTSGIATSGAVTRTATVTPTLSDTAPTWGTWDMAPNGAITITFVADVAPGAAPGVYDNTAYASATNHPMIDDEGPVGQDADTPPGEDPETDEDVTIEDPVIGAAKAVSTTVNNGDGTYTVAYTITVENLGSVSLNNVQVTDDLLTAFAGATSLNVVSVTSSDFTVNSGYNGSTHTDVLDGSDSLAAGASGAIVLTVRVRPGGNLGPYNNQATASGTSPGGATVSDLSDNGTDPDPNGNGDPTELGENDETPVTFTENPVIGVAKDMASVTNHGDGIYTVVYTLTVENFGDVPLINVQVTDSLTTTFSGVVSYTVDSVTSGDFTVNGGYDGDTDTDLLIGGDTLAVGASGTIMLTVTVRPGSNLGSYDNQARATATGPGGTPTNDLSDDGLDPDPNGNGDPTEQGENDPTPVTITENPVIGVAKDVASVTNHGDGTYTVVYTLMVENLGDVVLSSVQVTDDLSATFAGVISFTMDSLISADFTPNGSYDGDTDTDLLIGGDTLAVGASGSITLTVTVTPGADLGPHDNQASATGTSPASTTVSDLSDDGLDPDPNGNGDPTEQGENDPTPVTFMENPVIGAAKVVSSTVNHGDGTYTVVYTITVENLGDVMLSNLDVRDNMGTTFAGATGFVVDSVTSADFTVNGSYTGLLPNTSLLAGTDSLAIGQLGSIQLVVTVTPGGNLGPYNNQATAIGVSPANATVTDLSDDGTDPDPDGDGNPNELGENDETPVTFTENPVIGLAKDLGAVTNHGDGTYTITYTLTVENFGDVILSNVVITDDLVSQFAGLSPTGFAATSGTLNASGTWDGTAGSNILAGGQSLALGGTGTVQIRFTVTPGTNLGPHNNTAWAAGTSLGGTTVTDQSTDGLDPDPNQDDTPDESDPTPVTFTENPVVGVAKVVSAVVSNGDGTHTVTYTLRVENLGDVVLASVQVTDDLATTFSGAVGFGGASVSSDIFTANGGYTGSPPNIALLGGGDSLAVGNVGIITVTAVVTPGLNLGPYDNQAFASAQGPGGTPSDDWSDDGADPDADGDGNPNEAGENDPTPVSFSENPVIGVAKSVHSVSDNGDCTQTVTYTLVVENLGDVQLDNVQVTDNLSNTFVGSDGFAVDNVSSDILTVNSGYTGRPPSTSLLVGADSLALGQAGVITVSVTVTPCAKLGPYFNQATATGSSPNSGATIDLSDDGSDPDPDGDGNPNEAGENDPTPVTFTENPIIGVAKAISLVTNHGDGTYTVAYTLTVENLGNVHLYSVQVSDNLSNTFTGAIGFTVDSVNSTDFTVNGSYNGGSDTNLLIGADGLLVHQTGTIQLVVTVTPGTNLGPHNNQAVATAAGPGGAPTSDNSDAGVDPDPDGDGNPNELGENDPTPVTFTEDPVIGAAKDVASLTDNGNGTYTVVYTITVENLGDIILHSVQVTDDLDITFAGAVSYTVTSVASGEFTENWPPPGYDGSTDLNLLTGGDSLAVGATGAIMLAVILNPGTNPGPYNNSAYVYGTSPAGSTVSDWSDPGINPDPNGNGDPTEQGENDPTPLQFEFAQSLGDLVWWDVDGDGRQDPGEPGIPGVDVVLTDGAVLTATTDANGLYTFTNVLSDTYTVKIPDYEFQPGGTLENWLASPQDAAPDDVDSDGDETTHDVVVIVTGGDVITTTDFGFDITSSYTITKRLNTAEPVRVYEPLTLTIRITNTGWTTITVLPLQDVYSTTYMTYGYTDTFGVGTFASPDSDDHNDDGVIDWSDLTVSEGNLAPNDSVTVIVTFTAKADTHHVGLPNDETEDTATAHDVRADPDGPGGPLPEETIPADSATEGVEIEFPTGMVLASLNGVAQPDGMLVTWQTANEMEVLGFNLLRAEAGSEWVLLNEEFIFAEHSGSSQGADYGYRDGAVAPGTTYDYLLEIVKSDGSVEQHELGSVTALWWLSLPLVAR